MGRRGTIKVEAQSTNGPNALIKIAYPRVGYVSFFVNFILFVHLCDYASYKMHPPLYWLTVENLCTKIIIIILLLRRLGLQKTICM